MSIVLYMIDKARSVERKVHLVGHFTHQTLWNGDDIKHNIIHLQEMLISDCTASEIGVHSMPSHPHRGSAITSQFISRDSSWELNWGTLEWKCNSFSEFQQNLIQFNADGKEIIQITLSSCHTGLGGIIIKWPQYPVWAPLCGDLVSWLLCYAGPA